MPVVSHLSSIVVLVVLIISLQYGHIDGEKHRHRRQQQQQQQQQQQVESVPAKGSSQLLASSVQSRGYYQSAEFKPPSLSGEKPVGWFDTKYPNWISNQQTNVEKNGVIDGKNLAPSSLQAGAAPPRRDDGGAFFMQKLAKQYSNKGQKAFNYLQSTNQGGRTTVCSNFDNYQGFVFGKFPCPLPIGTGMNQLDRFCCGPINSQYCCNEQEFYYQSRPSYGGGQVHARHGQYLPSKNRAVAIVVPIVGTLVVAGALIIVFLYYKKLRSEQQKSNKPLVSPRTHENYSAVPQDAPRERSISNPNDPSNSNVHA